uniref:Putative secreted protein n=1 Tax=Anopheles darlingi TaxID=43151 RepID=A0A2M4DLJ8_ANODA
MVYYRLWVRAPRRGLLLLLRSAHPASASMADPSLTTRHPDTPRPSYHVHHPYGAAYDADAHRAVPP